MYTTLDTLPESVKASLDMPVQKQWMSVYNKAVKQGVAHRPAIHKAWDSVKQDPSCRYFAGFVSTNRLDKQNDSVDVVGAFKKISTFIERGGFITDTHSNRLVGAFFNAELRKAPSGSDGVYAYGVIFRGEPYFDSTWTAIKKATDCPTCHDVRKGTSIGGFALDTKIACNGNQCHRDILDLSIHEISVCQDPANPDAMIDQINHFAKCDSTIPDGSDVMKKAIVNQEGSAMMEEPNGGTMPERSPEEMAMAAEQGAGEAGELQAEVEEMEGGAPQEGGGLAEATQALNAVEEGGPEEGAIPTVDEIKALKAKLKNLDKIIREVATIREMIDGAGEGLEGGMEEGVEAGAEAPVEKATQRDSFYNNRDKYNKQKLPADIAVGAVQGIAGAVGGAIDAAHSGNALAVGTQPIVQGTGQAGNAANALASKHTDAKWHRELPNTNRRTNTPKVQTPPTTTAPKVQPKLPGTDMDMVKAHTSVAGGTPPTGSKNKKIGTKGVNPNKDVVGKGCGCMDTDVHTPITESKCPMDKKVYGDQIDPEKLKYLDNKHADDDTKRFKSETDERAFEGGTDLKALKMGEGPAVTITVKNKLPAEKVAKGEGNMTAHLKNDIKNENKIISTAKTMKAEDEGELEKCGEKEFKAKYGPKNAPKSAKSPKGTRIKGVGNEGKEVFMKAVMDALNKMDFNGSEEDAEELMDNVEEIGEEHEFEEKMSAEELIGMVMGFLKEKGIKVNLEEEPLDNSEIEGELEEPAEELLEDEYEGDEEYDEGGESMMIEDQDEMNECECLGKMAMSDFNMMFLANRLNMMDNKILERLEKTTRRDYDKWQVSGGTGRKFKHRMRDDEKKYRSINSAEKGAIREGPEDIGKVADRHNYKLEGTSVTTDKERERHGDEKKGRIEKPKKPLYKHPTDNKKKLKKSKEFFVGDRNHLTDSKGKTIIIPKEGTREKHILTHHSEPYAEEKKELDDKKSDKAISDLEYCASIIELMKVMGEIRPPQPSPFMHHVKEDPVARRERLEQSTQHPYHPVNNPGRVNDAMWLTNGAKVGETIEPPDYDGPVPEEFPEKKDYEKYDEAQRKRGQAIAWRRRKEIATGEDYPDVIANKRDYEGM